MRVAACIGTTSVIMLVDTSSTHNFINSKLVKQLSWPVCRGRRLGVTMADGGCLYTMGTYHSIPWELQGLQFFTDILVLPVKGHDLVIVIQWLQSLGTITWNSTYSPRSSPTKTRFVNCMALPLVHSS